MRYRRSAQGSVMPFIAIVLAAGIAFVGMSIDFSNSVYEKRALQAQADAASMAAALALSTAGGNLAVVSGAAMAAAQKYPKVVNPQPPTIRCGTWNAGAFTNLRPCTGIDTTVNAVRVEAFSEVPTFFPAFHGASATEPAAKSVSSVSFPSRCFKPFGVEQGSIQGVRIGSTFVTDSARGNWGKLFKDQVDFYDGMMSGYCAPTANLTALSDPGFTNPEMRVFDNFSYPQQMYLPVYSVVGVLNGQERVSIGGFARVTFRTAGGNGNGRRRGWRAEWILEEYPATPPGDPNSMVRRIVQ